MQTLFFCIIGNSSISEKGKIIAHQKDGRKKPNDELEDIKTFSTNLIIKFVVKFM
jgi:hypothetical protein